MPADRLPARPPSSRPDTLTAAAAASRPFPCRLTHLLLSMQFMQAGRAKRKELAMPKQAGIESRSPVLCKNVDSILAKEERASKAKAKRAGKAEEERAGKG